MREVRNLTGHYQKESKRTSKQIIEDALKVIKGKVKVKVDFNSSGERYKVPTWIYVETESVKPIKPVKAKTRKKKVN